MPDSRKSQSKSGIYKSKWLSSESLDDNPSLCLPADHRCKLQSISCDPIVDRSPPSCRPILAGLPWNCSIHTGRRSLHPKAQRACALRPSPTTWPYNLINTSRRANTVITNGRSHPLPSCRLVDYPGVIHRSAFKINDAHPLLGSSACTRLTNGTTWHQTRF
ncbi:hypothetical protein PGT21_032860 [Puccinia graminis f. sp. tritici]|uniref:Uncharacterized protein n=1 Tax=Puccinia graminis f. sp. tritici TaxID=56615 RepID=A0A5B0M1M7_PUCGR|nr:hypothetical protein PGT21_034515 [Puccinia graminis f. sp. tritici]KAA1104847.1 hypothetical protein PGT21_032860 [Puccinia graminis f. sp. tritici]